MRPLLGLKGRGPPAPPPTPHSRGVHDCVATRQIKSLKDIINTLHKELAEAKGTCRLLPNSGGLVVWAAKASPCQWVGSSTGYRHL